jgi:hypothetical protein
MALTLKRWIAFAVIGMLVVFLGLMIEPKPFVEPARERTADSLSNWAYSARYRANLYAQQYEIARLTDSLRGALSRPDPRPLRVFYGSRVKPEHRVVLDSTIMRAMARIETTPKVGIDIVVRGDTTDDLRGASRSNVGTRAIYTLPTPATPRCTVVIEIGRDYGANIIKQLRSEDAADQLMGPCAYYAAFGKAGPSVQEWLRRRAGMMAFGGSWTRAPEPVGKPYGLGENKFYGVYHPGLAYLSNRGIQCANGATQVCDSLALRPSSRSRFVTVGNSVMPSGSIGIGGWLTYSDFGGRENEMLAGMVRSLGRERFAAFWTSNDPVPLAFQNASGMELGDWVSTWVVEQYGAYKHGPRASGLAIVYAILVVSLALTLVTSFARRREFA